MIPHRLIRCFLILLAALGTATAAEDQTIDENQARLELARVLRDNGELKPAIATYREVLAATPGNTAAAAELAQALTWNKQPDEARELLAAIPPEQFTAPVLETLADLQIEAGDFPEATATLRRALALEATDSARQRLAAVLSWQKEYAEALTLYADLVGRHPKDIQLRRRYAQTLGWAGQPAAAADQWKLSLDPAR